MCGIVCVGADLAAAAYADATVAAAATTANHNHHDDHNRGQWDNHGVHSGERDRP